MVSHIIMSEVQFEQKTEGSESEVLTRVYQRSTAFQPQR